MSKFYTIYQNNSGGYNIQNDDVDRFVCVEADNVEMAKSKFKEILAPYREYCPFHGERWNDNFLDEKDGFSEPTIYEEKYTEFADEFWCKYNSIIIYYINGDIEKYNLKKNLKKNLKNMRNIEKGWMIRRDDGMFFAMEDYKGDAVFCDDLRIFNGVMNTKKECKNIIKFYKLQNCRPVKVEIKVVGE